MKPWMYTRNGTGTATQNGGEAAVANKMHALHKGKRKVA